jgi:signal transduction histidine kinase
VLGHDLRNPLFAISAGAEMLLRKHRIRPSTFGYAISRQCATGNPAGG